MNVFKTFALNQDDSSIIRVNFLFRDDANTRNKQLVTNIEFTRSLDEVFKKFDLFLN